MTEKVYLMYIRNKKVTAKGYETKSIWCHNINTIIIIIAIIFIIIIRQATDGGSIPAHSQVKKNSQKGQRYTWWQRWDDLPE